MKEFSSLAKENGRKWLLFSPFSFARFLISWHLLLPYFCGWSVVCLNANGAITLLFHETTYFPLVAFAKKRKSIFPTLVVLFPLFEVQSKLDLRISLVSSKVILVTRDILISSVLVSSFDCTTASLHKNMSLSF